MRGPTAPVSVTVLGANPGRVLEVIDVQVARARNPEQFLSGHFLATKKRLEQLIHDRETEPKQGSGNMASIAA